MENTLILIRHVSGAGSSTLANSIKEICDIGRVRCVVAAADQYFEKDGEYKWNPAELFQAHSECQKKVANAMFFKVPVVIVTNTFTSQKDMDAYIQFAEEYHYRLVSFVLENRHGNKDIHNVPEKTLQIQETKIKNSLKLK
jgi:2',3'-cyclic-nucleotide 3'-phosphodiesterase/NEDD4-binding protein 2